jgi:hypothetical protein
MDAPTTPLGADSPTSDTELLPPPPAGDSVRAAGGDGGSGAGNGRWPAVLDAPSPPLPADRAAVLRAVWDAGALSVYACTWNMHAKVRRARARGRGMPCTAASAPLPAADLPARTPRPPAPLHSHSRRRTT